MRFISGRLTLVFASALAGCMTVGPDYHGAPERTPRDTFVRAESDVVIGTPQSTWWRTLQDPVLNELVESALASNSDIRIAMSRLDQSRALRRERRADSGPEGEASASYARTKPYLTQYGLAPAENRAIDLYHADLDASWELDFFGGKRRNTEAAQALVDAADATLDDARVSIASEVAQAYIDLRVMQSLLAHTQRIARADLRLITLTEQRVAEGVASQLDLGRIRYQWRMTVADEPALRGEIAVQMDRLAVLSGRDPGTMDAVLSRDADIPKPPETVPIDDPATLLRHRPDIRVAERQLAAATARIGVETAKLFPQVTLEGEIGFASLDASSFMSKGTEIYSVGPAISWNFLDYSRIKARMVGADKRREEMLIRHEQVVRAALQDTEASLVRIARSRETVTARQATLAAARGAAELIEQRYDEGHLSLLDAITARREETRAHARLIAANGDVTKAYIAVHKSLGLAWGSGE
jgi:outer membrane protein, multidrug efflux system